MSTSYALERERERERDSSSTKGQTIAKYGDQLTFYRGRAAGRQLHQSLGVRGHKRASSWPLNHKTQSASPLQALTSLGCVHVYLMHLQAHTTWRDHKSESVFSKISFHNHYHTKPSMFMHIHKCGYLTSIEGSIPVH